MSKEKKAERPELIHSSEEASPEKRKKKKKKLPLWRKAAVMACLAALLVSGGMAVREMVRSSREQGANRDLAQRVRQVKLDLSGDGEEDSKYAPNGNLIQYDALWQENHDLAGWLWIPDTNVNLPVMNNPADPEFYLRRAFDGSNATSGCLFLGAGYRPDGNYAIIYGHNMNNGTMFGELDQYRDREYAQAHAAIHFDTMTEERTYTVLGAFNTQIYRQDQPGVFRYYDYPTLMDEDEFNEYVAQVRQASLYDLGTEVQYGDQLLTLSTCSYHHRDGRFVVVACRTPEPGEEGSGGE